MIIISILHEIILSLCESLVVFYLFTSTFDTLMIQNNLNNLFKYVDNHIAEIKTLITKDDIDVLRTKIIVNNHENQTIWKENKDDTLNKVMILAFTFIVITHIFIVFVSMYLNINPLKFMMNNLFLITINACVEITFAYMITKYQFM